MKFIKTEIAGAYILELERREDHRGFFARMFCHGEFANHNLDPGIAQINTGVSTRAGTLRGMHFQTAPYEDNKLVKCLRGKVYDVCLDLRPNSETFKRHVAVELSADNRRMLYLPPGCGHGYQSLTDEAEIMYTTNREYHAQSATGVRHNDPSFGLQWPMPITEISEADSSWPDFEYQHADLS